MYRTYILSAFILLLILVGCDKDEFITPIDYRQFYSGQFQIQYIQSFSDDKFPVSNYYIDTNLLVDFYYHKNEFVKGLFFDTIPQRAIHMKFKNDSFLSEHMFQIFESGELKIDPGFSFPEYIGEGGFKHFDTISFQTAFMSDSRSYHLLIRGKKVP